MIVLRGKDIRHGSQFSKKDIDAVLKTTFLFRKRTLEKGPSQSARGKILATLFYWPNTRTRLSF